jgi:hypothetical protein
MHIDVCLRSTYKVLSNRAYIKQGQKILNLYDAENLINDSPNKTVAMFKLKEINKVFPLAVF